MSQSTLSGRDPGPALAFLERHPAVRYVDLMLCDSNGLHRGMRLPAADLARAHLSGVCLPGSMFSLDVRGGTVQTTGLGFDEGDADRPCFPVPGTLVPVPWLDGTCAQMALEMFERDGTPFFADPRQVLAGVLQRYAQRGLTPVLALELEFYIVDRERTQAGLPQPPVWRSHGRRAVRNQVNGMEDLDEHAPLLHGIVDYCQVQDVATGTLQTECGPAQFEINLRHVPDALEACDQAVRFRRIVRALALRHGYEATFMSKPYRDEPGSGAHLHVSLLDDAGRNVFASEHCLGSPLLRHAAAGLLAHMADGMAIFAANANAYRRFRPESYVPLTPSWGYNHRGVALRIPASAPQDRRIEHRVAGADANLYLLAAAVLAGMHAGLEAAREPPAPFSGHANEAPGSRLPATWDAALARLEASAHAREYFGARWVDFYVSLKRAEMDDFARHVSPVECDWYLGAL